MEIHAAEPVLVAREPEPAYGSVHGVHIRHATGVYLRAVEPFDGEGLLAFLAARAIPGLEEVEDGTYRRTLRLEHGAGVIEATPDATGVRCEFSFEDGGDAEEAAARVRRLFDLDADPEAIAAVLGADPLLAPLVERRPGMRVPGTVDPFELVVRAIVGQQVSVAGARTVLGRIVETYGGFPVPAALAAADPGSFPFPRARANALIEVARLAAAGELRLDALTAIPGIGPWTASYVAMRALGDPDVFLPGDVGVRNALARLGGAPDPERWRPWRSYAVMHLWRSLGG
jgi:AraC family transcriptional regulator of adaptative response / DNA-3-methyladenine glycosylase II